MPPEIKRNLLEEYLDGIKALPIIIFLIIVTSIVLSVAYSVPFDEARWHLE